MKILLTVVFCLLTMSCNSNSNSKQINYVGLSKEQLWISLCSQSGDAETSVIAYQYPDEGSYQQQRSVMINKSHSRNIPEVFNQAKKWRWDSPDRRFHTFFFDAKGKVISTKIADINSWRP